MSLCRTSFARTRRLGWWWSLPSALLLGVLALGLGTRPAQAQFTRFQNFTDEQGLGNLAVDALVQDRDGYVLLGTQAGLYRYDGSGIGPCNPDALSAVYIRQLVLDEAGRVWVVTEHGLYVRSGDALRRVDTGPAPLRLGSSHLLALAGRRAVLDVDGTLLAAPVEAGLIGRFGPLFDAATLAHSPDLRRARFVTPDAQGGLLIGCGLAICRTSGGAPGMAQGGQVAVLGAADGLPPDAWQVALQTPDGTIWARSLGRLAWRRRGEALFTVVTPPGSDTRAGTGGVHASYASRPSSLDLLDDRHGGILTQTADGLVDWNGVAWHAYAHHSEGLPNSRLEAFTFDREGSLWVGSLGRGAFRSIGLDRWEHWTEDDGLPSSAVWSIVRLPNRQLWVTTDNGSVTVQGAAARIPSETSYSAEATRAGGLWLAPVDAPPMRYDSRYGTVERFPALGRVSIVRVDAGNRLWIATGAGLFMAADADAPASALHPVRVLPADVDFITADAAGAVWVLSPRGVFRWGGGGFDLVVPPALLAESPVALAFAPGNELWIATASDGVQRFRLDDGRVRALPSLTAPAIGSNNVLFAYRDRRGWMWLGTDHGIDLFDGRGWQRFDSGNGLITNDIDQYAVDEDTDGSMWFGTSHGLSHLVDPARTPAPATLHPLVTGLSLGHRVLPVATTIRTDWSRAPLVIRFVDLDYAHGRDISFRYRLRGLDDGWSTTAGHEVRYADLPAGKLRFELVAVDAAHGAISAPIGFTIRIRPPWWRRPWFYGLSALAVAAALVGAWRMRVSLLVGHQRRLETVVRARTAEIEQARTRLEQQAAELARQAASLQRMAMSDALTGLANRRAIMTALEEAVAAPPADGHLAVLLCDIDHFKRINDGHGHLAGDAVLAAFGARLRAIVAGPELAGRYGGEEFLVILHGEAGFVAARAAGIHAGLTVAPYRFADADRFVTSSGGLARLRAGDTALSLLGRADEALYRAKEYGRNRIETERPDPTPGMPALRVVRRPVAVPKLTSRTS